MHHPLKADPETMALRAQPRPVVRLNRRVLAVGAGALAAAVLGGTLWSLQSQQRSRAPTTELFNVDRITRSRRAWTSCRRTTQAVPPALKATPPRAGRAAARRSGASHREVAAADGAAHGAAGYGSGAAGGRRGGAVIGVLPGNGERHGAANRLLLQRFLRSTAAANANRHLGFEPESVQCDGGWGVARCHAERSDYGAEPAGRERGLPGEGRGRSHAQSWEPATARIAVPGDGGHSDSGCAGDGDQFGSARAGDRQL
jgi:hypothetical protein